MDLLDKIRYNASQYGQRIILPESEDARVLEAADIAIKNELAKIILIGKEEKFAQSAEKHHLHYLNSAEIVDPDSLEKEEAYVKLMLDIRKGKGLTEQEAITLLKDPLYLSTIMIKNGDADGEVAGAMNATGDVLRPAFQYIKTKPGISIVSGAFIMIIPDKLYGNEGIMVFADCAVNPEPNAQQLAEIAFATAETTKSITGFDPRIAMLSFSTKGSAKHSAVDKVKEAADIVHKSHPELIVDGELQADAAIVDNIALKKAPDSVVKGKANVLIFPNLESGNIAYKLVQRLGRAEAIGPILQGLAAPINDLSRGCSVEDIVNMIAITANQAHSAKEIA